MVTSEGVGFDGHRWRSCVFSGIFADINNFQAMSALNYRDTF